MSRAFVKEDDFLADLPDRPVSDHPNHVTARGLALIDAELDTARRAFAAAQATGDRSALAAAARDVRYWSERRATADVAAPPSATLVVQFGNRVTIARDDGREQTFQIVGEDEADPKQGTLSHASPLARALLGKSVGDVVRAGDGEAEIIAID